MSVSLTHGGHLKLSRAKIKLWLHFVLVLSCGRNHFTSLSLSFLLCRMEVMPVTVEVNEGMRVKGLLSVCYKVITQQMCMSPQTTYIERLECIVELRFNLGKWLN